MIAAEERFMDKVVWNGEEDECWTWSGATRNGYGRFGLRSDHVVEAHRFSYELFVGPIPEGLDLDHTCHNGTGCTAGHGCHHRSCVNPAHLEPVTRRENLRRAAAGRTHCPQGHPYSGENLYVTPKGTRQCRICKRAATRKSLARRGHDAGQG